MVDHIVKLFRHKKVVKAICPVCGGLAPRTEIETYRSCWHCWEKCCSAAGVPVHFIYRPNVKRA